jgi:GNAT superfamily N-acetyltransferase
LPENTIVRPFREDDLPPVYGLVHKTIEISYRSDYSEKAIELFKTYHSRENILDSARNGYTVVAVEEGKIVGTGTLLDTNIRRIFISPLHQRRGIGTLIYENLEHKARADNISALDLSSAIGSRPFWESRGFIIQEELFIPPGKDWIIRYYSMVKDLTGAV